MSDLLGRLAQRLESDERFLAAVLAEYARAEDLDDTGLARALGCRLDDLTALRLCRSPRSEPANFRADARVVAERFGLDAIRLMEIVRHAVSLRALRGGAAGGPGSLLAARDHEEPTDDSTKTSGP